jgi:hypothetical protein
MIKDTSVSESTVDKIIMAGHQIYDPIADKVGEIIEINKNWESQTRDAETKRWIGYVIVNLSGGIARDPEVSSEGFAFIMCHELNHLYGGAPFIVKWQELSAEGQAAQRYAVLKCDHMWQKITSHCACSRI